MEIVQLFINEAIIKCTVICFWERIYVSVYIFLFVYVRYQKSKRVPEKHLCFIDYAKAFDCVDYNKMWKILKEMGYQITFPASWEICMPVKKQQLELVMEEQTGSKSGKEYC